MRVVRDAFALHLLGLPSIVSALSTFRDEPAIFTRSPIPPSAEGTYIVIRDAHIDDFYGSKWSHDTHPADYVPTKGRYVEHDIGIYSDQTGDSSDIEDLALSVRNAFDRVPIPISGYGVLIAAARGPISAPMSESDEDEINGRIVTVGLTVIENP